MGCSRLRKDQIKDECHCDKTAIKIGDGKCVEAAADAIVGILESTADQDTIRKALDTLTAMCSIKNVSIVGNSITMGEHKCRCKSDK